MTEIPDFAIKVKKKELPKDNPQDLPDYILDEPQPFSLYITDHALSGIRRYARQNPDNEIGGVLLGRHFTREDKTVVVITNEISLPSRSTSTVYYDFDDSTFLALNTELRNNPKSYIVGWFHSHTGSVPPFMSPDDKETHRAYFEDCWYVSCVVASGDELLPVSFWRMEGEELIDISEHFIYMTQAANAVEQYSRFLSVSSFENRAIDRIAELMNPILSDLGVGEDDSLSCIFKRQREEELQSPYLPDLRESLDTLLRLSLAIASDDSVVREVGELQDRLKVTRSLEGSLRLVIATDSLQDKIVVYGNRGYTFTPGQQVFHSCDLVENTILRVEPPHPVPIMALDCSLDSSVWALTSCGELVYFPHIPPLKMNGDRRLFPDQPDIPCKEIATLSLDSSPLQLTIANDNTFWVRTNEWIYSLRVILNSRKQPTGVTDLASLPLQGENCLVLGSLQNEDISVVGTSNGNIVVWNSMGKELKKAPLLPPWNEWKLCEACATGVGIFALFNDGAFNQLAVFEEDSLELVAHYLQYQKMDAREQLLSICSDNMFRCYLRKGRAIWLISDTGSPSNDWYHYQTRQQEGSETS